MPKVSDFTAASAVTDDDLLYLIDTPGSTPSSRKVTAAVLKDYAAAPSTDATVTYTADSSTIYDNPERGFFTYTESHYYPGVTTDPQHGGSIPAFDPVNQSTITTNRTSSSQSLVFRYYYMEKYRGQDSIDEAFFDLIDVDMAAVRAAGCKAVLRFAYSNNDPGGAHTPPMYADTTVSRTYGHIDQLLPVLNANADVIVSVNAGLIGIWGEWFYSDNWGNLGTLTTANWTDRAGLLRRWIAGLPETVAVSVRYPVVARFMVEQGYLTLDEYQRMGTHNDAFMASPGDWGTYDVDFRRDGTAITSETINQQRAWHAGVAGGKLMGGESANATGEARTGWSAADTDLALFHWTYLSPVYHPDLLATWGANIDIAKRKLGHRLRLTSGSYQTTASTTGTVGVQIGLTNDGYAAPVFDRPVHLVFNQTTGNTYTRELPLDVRRLAPGVTMTVKATVDAPPKAGTYNLHLHLPDRDPVLALRPEYSIRMANSSVWSSGQGWNNLNRTVVVS